MTLDSPPRPSIPDNGPSEIAIVAEFEECPQQPSPRLLQGRQGEVRALESMLHMLIHQSISRSLARPDFADFETRAAACITDNHSFLFKNTSSAWHGATALTFPDDSYRRLLNIIFEMPRRSAGPKLVNRARGLFKLSG